MWSFSQAPNDTWLGSGSAQPPARHLDLFPPQQCRLSALEQEEVVVAERKHPKVFHARDCGLGPQSRGQPLPQLHSSVRLQRRHQPMSYSPTVMDRRSSQRPHERLHRSAEATLAFCPPKREHFVLVNLRADLEGHELAVVFVNPKRKEPMLF